MENIFLKNVVNRSFCAILCSFVVLHDFSFAANDSSVVNKNNVVLNKKVKANDKKNHESNIFMEKDKNIIVRVGGEVDFSSYHAQNEEEFKIGSGGHFVNRLYNGGVLVDNPSSVASSAELKKDHDGGVMGDYTASYGITNSSGFFIFTENKFNDELSYGGKMTLSISTGKSRAVKTSEAYMFVNTEYGVIELGTTDGATERMKLDAAVISSAGGGIGSGWFMYNNIEGAYINAVYDSTSTTSSKRNRDVRRPFHILPMLYSEYTHKSGPWQRHNNSIIGIYPPKMSYYSPNLDSGFSFGVSYTYDEGYLYSRDIPQNEREEYKNVFGIGVIYERALENIKLKFSFTGERGDYKNDLNNGAYNYYDLLGWNFGGMVGYAGFKFVASYANLYKSGLAKTVIIDKDLNKAIPSAIAVNPGDTTYFTLGASYEAGPSVVSIGYFRSKTSPISDDYKNILKNFSISSHYNLSGKKHQLTPYVSLNCFTTDEAFAEDGNNPGYENNKGYVLVAGMSLKF